MVFRLTLLNGYKKDKPIRDWAVGNEQGDHFTLAFQCNTTFIGNADEDSIYIECGREKID